MPHHSNWSVITANNLIQLSVTFVTCLGSVYNRYSHPGQLSLAIPPWLGTTSTSESWDVNMHYIAIVQYIDPWSGSVNWCLAEG